MGGIRAALASTLLAVGSLAAGVVAAELVLRWLARIFL